jgi:hypothetical protein
MSRTDLQPGGENRELAIERFVELLQDAVKQVPIRKIGSAGPPSFAAWRRKSTVAL